MAKWDFQRACRSAQTSSSLFGLEQVFFHGGPRESCATARAVRRPTMQPLARWPGGMGGCICMYSTLIIVAPLSPLLRRRWPRCCSWSPCPGREPKRRQANQAAHSVAAKLRTPGARVIAGNPVVFVPNFPCRHPSHSGRGSPQTD